MARATLHQHDQLGALGQLMIDPNLMIDGRQSRAEYAGGNNALITN
jgi:hypothetical protein